MKSVARACLDDATLAAFLDNHLDQPARAAAEVHLADCPTCCGLLMNAAKTECEMNGTGLDESRPSSRTRWTVAAGGLAAAAVLFLVLRVQPDWMFGRWSASGRHMAALIDAIGDQRPIEARLAHQTRYVPLRPATRGTPEQQNVALLEASTTLQRAAAADPSPGNLHAWGVAQLLLGQYNEAVTTLERASAAETNASIATDLSAAYLARASFTGESDDLRKALGEAGRALRSTPESEAAHFNRALALERLERYADARREWTELLDLNPRSVWAGEIRTRRQSLPR